MIKDIHSIKSALSNQRTWFRIVGYNILELIRGAATCQQLADIYEHYK